MSAAGSLRHPGAMTTIQNPRTAAAEVARTPILPTGPDETVTGFGVMGLPFASGHYLALRDFPAASFLPDRCPATARCGTATPTARGRSTPPRPPSTVAPATSVRPPPTTPSSVRSRSPGPATTRSSSTSPTSCTGPSSCTTQRRPGCSPRSGHAFRTASGRTRARSAPSADSPAPCWAPDRCGWRAPCPTGRPSGSHPSGCGRSASSRAELHGHDLGDIAPLPDQARLGDFRPPQRGLAVVGQGRFDAFDPTRHRTAAELACPPAALRSTIKPMDSGTGPTRAELLAALSVAVDLGLGQPAEHMLRSALIGTRIADRLGLARAQRDCIYYTDPHHVDRLSRRLA